MSNHPILFKADMVKAILDGRKTQARRIVTVPWHKGKRCAPYDPYWTIEDGKLLGADEYGDWHEKTSPYGVPGDLLYVREKWWAVEADEIGVQYCVFDDEFKDGIPGPKELRLLDRQNWKYGRHPNIHLPKKHARLWLRVKSVRVERVQEITQDDAIAEGVSLDEHDMTCMGDCANRHCDKINEKDLCSLYHTDEDCPETEAFGMLWDSINKDRGYGWDTNPWVWVVEFERSNSNGKEKR